jgi:outer membrane protein W
MTHRFFNLMLGSGLFLIGTTALAQDAAPEGAAAPASAPGQAPVAAPAPARGAIEIGLRLGVGFPLGHEGATAGDTNDKLSDDVKLIVPIAIDAGYRINPNVYVGLLFQYGFGIVNTDSSSGAACGGAGVSCSASDLRLGVDLHFHFAPGQSFDPWLGVGAGYEWLFLDVSDGGISGSITATGFEFGNVQLGGDIPIAPNFAVGPFVSLSFGQYSNVSVSQGGASMDMSITSKSFHEWLEFGVRGVYDIGL